MKKRKTIEKFIEIRNFTEGQQIKLHKTWNKKYFKIKIKVYFELKEKKKDYKLVVLWEVFKKSKTK